MVKEFKGCTSQSDKQVDTTIDSEEHVDARNRLRNNSAEHVDAISYSEKLVVDGSDPKSDSRVATHTTNAEPLDASINGFSTVNEHSTSYFSGVGGVETISAEVANVNLRERMNFASNSVFGETPKFMDLGL